MMNYEEEFCRREHNIFSDDLTVDETLDLHSQWYFENSNCNVLTGECSDYYWIQNSLYNHRTLEDQRFLKYLMVKYEFVYDCDNPLQGLLDRIAQDSRFARKVYLEYYLLPNYQYVFLPEEWYDKRVTDVIAFYNNAKPVRPDKVLTDNVLLERYFGMQPGDLKRHPENEGYQWVDRYAPIRYTVKPILSKTSIIDAASAAPVSDNSIISETAAKSNLNNIDLSQPTKEEPSNQASELRRSRRIDYEKIDCNEPEDEYMWRRSKIRESSPTTDMLNYYLKCYRKGPHVNGTSLFKRYLEQRRRLEEGSDSDE